MQIGRLIDIAADRCPDKVALISRDNRWTYRQFRERIQKLSSALIRLGIKKGDHVSTVTWNGNQMLEVYWASVRIGAVFNPLNFRFTSAEMAYVLKDSAPKLIVVDENFQDLVGNAVDDPKLPDHLYSTANAPRNGFKRYEDLIEGSPIFEGAMPVSGNDPCELIYTSGTTSNPKGVLLSHNNVCWNALITSQMRRDNYNEVQFMSAPLFHVAALNCQYTGRMITYPTLVLLEKFDPQKVMDAVVKERVTMLSMGPTMWIFLMEFCKPGDYDTSSVTVLTSGGDKLPIETIKAVQPYFPNLREKGIYNLYGLTEATSTVTVLQDRDSVAKSGSIGLPSPFVQARLIDDEGREVEKGQVGELTIRGPITMMGYLHQPEMTAEVLKDGWLHTGDMAWADEEGYLFLADRKKDIIVSGGENISSREVEDVLYKHPAILKVACFAAPDPKWNERVVAAIILRPGQPVPTIDEIREHCRKDLAGFKLPKEIMIVDSLPETGYNKVKKFELKKIYMERLKEKEK